MQALCHRYLNLFIRYAGVGIIGTGVHYWLFLILIDSRGPVVASTIGATFGLVVNYCLVRNLVFGNRTAGSRAFRRFSVVAASGVLVNSLIMFALSPWIHAVAAQVVATGCILVNGFLFNNVWSFSERAR